MGGAAASRSHVQAAEVPGREGTLPPKADSRLGNPGIWSAGCFQAHPPGRKLKSRVL